MHQKGHPLYVFVFVTGERGTCGPFQWISQPSNENIPTNETYCATCLVNIYVTTPQLDTRYLTYALERFDSGLDAYSRMTYSSA